MQYLQFINHKIIMIDEYGVLIDETRFCLFSNTSAQSTVSSVKSRCS
jgi:hypothetical protein